jgi:hypothetical protein
MPVAVAVDALNSWRAGRGKKSLVVSGPRVTAGVAATRDRWSRRGAREGLRPGWVRVTISVVIS